MPDGSRRLLAGVLVAIAAGALLRGAWLTADPPTLTPVGVVWHDEGAWVHNARNRALWGTWRTDEWNPVFVAPVFTGLEYAAFRAFGVGTWQARTVPLVSGLLAVAALAIGLSAVTGRRTALIGACLLATNYVFVMWNRAALMESTMTAFIVGAWAAYAIAVRRPVWGLAAGTLATLAWFSKAAAAFFVAAVVLDSLVTLALARAPGLRRRLGIPAPTGAAVRGAAATLVGLGVSAAVIVALFVVPHWTEYRFYNWQMSVMRKPSYTIRALVDRASWLPIVQDFFTRMWVVLVAAALATGGIVARWRSAVPAERLLVLWLVVGLVELVVHDAGNERRYVMLIPALIGLAAMVVGSPGSLAGLATGRQRWLALPLVVALAYLVIGSLLRMAFLSEVRAGDLQLSVRLSALAATAVATLVVWKWRSIADWLARQAISARDAAVLVALVVLGDLGQYAQWASRQTDLNYRASIEVGRILPPGTLVHGKLANGLALENRIRPVFVG
ncbi:MAG: glycosyltransferase family 39 protein, partial [Vicinamibacteria bacterium]|nr:glycosyltransferase family 39 protein [Vicinamibacteria bacterium]